VLLLLLAQTAGYPNLIDQAQGKGPQYSDPARWLMYQVGTAFQTHAHSIGFLLRNYLHLPLC
jgi:hypothetical protein